MKNVDVSGTVAYRYNDYEEGNVNNNYKIAVNLKSKVTDDVTFNSRVIAGNQTNAGEVSLNTNTTDSNVNAFLSEANFAYSGLSNSIVTVGKQGIATPFTIARDSIGNESTGTGIVGNTSLGMISLAGGYFNQTNFNNNDASLTNINGKDLYFVAANLAVAGIVLDAA
uniref:hypothetical protein n=1 Tax=Aliarcobacter sp. TaxID=2321116 RepID=UPI0040484FDD